MGPRTVTAILVRHKREVSTPQPGPISEICATLSALAAMSYKNEVSKDASMRAFVPTADLERMLAMAAELVCHDRVYVPIFLRVEQELTARQDADDAVSRARAICKLQKARA